MNPNWDLKTKKKHTRKNQVILIGFETNKIFSWIKNID